MKFYVDSILNIVVIPGNEVAIDEIAVLESLMAVPKTMGPTLQKLQVNFLKGTFYIRAHMN